MSEYNVDMMYLIGLIYDVINLTSEWRCLKVRWRNDQNSTKTWRFFNVMCPLGSIFFFLNMLIGKLRQLMSDYSYISNLWRGLHWCTTLSYTLHSFLLWLMRAHWYTIAPESSVMLFCISSCSFVNDMISWKAHGLSGIWPSYLHLLQRCDSS